MSINESILLMGAVILICILTSRFLQKIPVPSLLLFLALGMCFGENGPVGIVFDDYAAVNVICSASLICIMFYGGFGTNLSAARPVLGQAAVLSTLGVAGTAGAVALFAHLALDLPMLESFLIGAVISSTDAASVFNILRCNKLALKDHTDSLLEVESGSNDPMSYMLTAAAVALMAGQQISVPLLLFRQLALAIACGLILGALAARLLGSSLLLNQESRTVFLFGVMLLSYALPAVLGGNGYLAVYLCGIRLGNTRLTNKRYLVHFFDVLTDVSQVIIFFLLGLLVTPAELPAVLLPALAIMAFLTLVARPVVTGLLLLPFRSGLGQMGLVSWAGLRGAASIVFAISAVLGGVSTRYNLYNLVFCIVLLSISLQGTLLPRVARRLGMVDRDKDVNKTFSDYQEEGDIQFVRLQLRPGHRWCGRTLGQLALPADLLVATIFRAGQALVPSGSTVLEPGDVLVLAAKAFEGGKQLGVRELEVDGRWAGKTLSDVALDKGELVILVKRGTANRIPTGSTVLRAGDVLVLAQPSEDDA